MPMNPAMLGKVLKVLGGTAAGGAFGYYATPELFGYQDVPAAKRTAMTLDAVLGGVLAGIGRKNLGLLVKKPETFTSANIGPYIARAGSPGLAAVGAETIPIIQAGLHKQREAAGDISQAARSVATSGERTSIPGSLRTLLSSPVGRGAGIGAAGAGLAGILTGLQRRQTEGEMENKTTRSKMVGKDFLKYLIPAVLAGGIAGSFVPKQQ